METGDLVRVFDEAEPQYPYSRVFDAPDTLSTTVTDDGVVEIFAGEDLLHTLSLPGIRISRVFWHPDGDRLATISGDVDGRNYLHIWDVSALDDPILIIETPKYSVTPLSSFAWHPNGRNFAISQRGSGVSIWEEISSQEDECLESFHIFAYHGPTETYEFNGYTLPVAPWEAVSDVPPHPFVGYYDHISELHVAITRKINTQNEIWLTGHIYSLELPPMGIVVRYETGSHLWELIDGRIPGTEFYVNDLLATSDGIIWGIVEWWYPGDTSHLTHMPVLSRFNEDTRRFEFPERATDILLTSEMPDNLSSPLVLIDQEDVFWIFVDHDGLYRYDPDTIMLEKMVDLDFAMGYATLAPDGSIYFDKRAYYLIDEEMFQFLPATQDLITIPAPGESWPLPIGMLVDRKEQLWLGVSGYRDLNGTWNLIYPSPEDEAFFEYLGYPLNGPPMLLLESSDGRFWYRKYHDSSGWNEGAAWYDPETGEGCMFTNFPATVVEDSEQNMWLVAAGELYKYSLNQ